MTRNRENVENVKEEERTPSGRKKPTYTKESYERMINGARNGGKNSHRGAKKKKEEKRFDKEKVARLFKRKEKREAVHEEESIGRRSSGEPSGRGNREESRGSRTSR